MRSGETNGADYHFVSQDEMLKQLENGEFIEAGRYRKFKIVLFREKSLLI